MQARPSPKDEFGFAALLFCSAIPYNEVIPVFLVERLGPFLALACAAAYCIGLYMRAGKAPGRDWLAWFPVSLALSAGAAGLGVATALLITFLGYRPPHNLIAPAPLAAKMIIATTIGPLWEELLTRGLLFRAVREAMRRRAGRSLRFWWQPWCSAWRISTRTGLVECGPSQAVAHTAGFFWRHARQSRP